VTLHAPLALRRLLAVAILLLPLLLLWLLTVEPLIMRHGETREAMERSLQLLARYKANAAEKPALEQRVRQRRQSTPQNQALIDAPNAALATSALQSGLRRLLEANGGSVRVMSVASPVREQGYDRFTARAELGVSADRLIDIIHALEISAAPNLIIDSFDVRAPDHAGQTRRPDENVSLVVRVDVSGFWEPR
jgi:hypothetical protein